MTLDEIIAQLDDLATTPLDGESDHSHADGLLLAALRESGNAAVADAYDRAKQAAAYWVYA